MSARILAASLITLVGIASPAFAYHPKGTHFFGLTWGSAPSGVAVPGSYGVAPSGVQSYGIFPSGVSSYGVFPSGVTSYGVFPSGVFPSGITSYGVFPSGVTSYGVFPSGVFPSGIFPSGTRPPTDAEAQGLQNWLNLINRGCQIVGGTTSSVSSQDISTLKADLATVKATNQKILAELSAIRKGMGYAAPTTPKTGGGGSSGGKDLPDDMESRRAPAKQPIVAAIDRDLSDIAALQKQLAEKEAKRVAARKQATGGNTVAINR